MKISYRIIERFSPKSGSQWTDYVKFSRFSHLKEVVGLDCCLCPSVLEEYCEEDWQHLVFPEHIFAAFDNLEYASQRTQNVFDPERHQVIALAREPNESDVLTAHIPNFRFVGFELIEEATEISAITNCGGFEGAFTAKDVSEYGLIPTARRAYEIRQALATLFPDEPHADCTVWAIWRRNID